MRKVIVNPKEGFLAFDSLGRVIPFRDGGTELNKTTVISRQLKCGDLVLVEPKKTKKAEDKKAEYKKDEVYK